MKNLPIPMTVPYSLEVDGFSSALTGNGHKQIIPMRTIKEINRHDDMRLDCVRVGRREKRGIVMVFDEELASPGHSLYVENGRRVKDVAFPTLDHNQKIFLEIDGFGNLNHPAK
jgi:hypothetical protein